ncbi:Reeler domain [Trinorchestia longiramus]|nr:Reeler domain [Trinorchestia longiramus]
MLPSIPPSVAKCMLPFIPPSVAKCMFPCVPHTVSIQGWRTHYSVEKFTGFMLVVDGLTSSYSNMYGPQSVGTFQLYGDVLTMHSDDCPNAVVHTSNSPKSEIQVLWTAPPAGSGCVRFSCTAALNEPINLELLITMQLITMQLITMQLITMQLRRQNTTERLRFCHQQMTSD